MERKGLANLVGEIIVDIEIVDYDLLGDGERVDELYRVTLASGKKVHLLCDGGDCAHYGTIDSVNVGEDGKIKEKYHSDSGKFLGEFKSLRSRK